MTNPANQKSNNAPSNALNNTANDDRGATGLSGETEINNAMIRICTCENLLMQYRSVHLLSCGLTVSGTLALLFVLIMDNIVIYWLASALLMILLGAFETLLAVRVGFDAALLRQLANARALSANSLDELDRALTQLKLLPAHKTGRALEARLSGCLSLFKQQIWVCGLQLVTLFGATAIILMRAW